MGERPEKMNFMLATVIMPAKAGTLAKYVRPQKKGRPRHQYTNYMPARTTETTETTNNAPGTPASVKTQTTSAHLHTAGLSSMMETTAGTPAITGKSA